MKGIWTRLHTILAIITFAMLMVLGVVALPLEAQTKAVWDYTCYQRPDALVNFINTLPAVKAEKVKVFTPNLGSANSYCLVYQK